jgi:hypothetical protein
MLDPPNSVRHDGPLPEKMLTQTILDAALEIIELREGLDAYAPHTHLATAAARELCNLQPSNLLQSYVCWINSALAMEPRFHACNNIIGIAADRGRILKGTVILIFPPMPWTTCQAVNELLITHGGRGNIIKMHQQRGERILWCSFDGTEEAATASQVSDGLSRIQLWLRGRGTCYRSPSLLLFTAFLYFEDLNLTNR